MEKKLSRAAMSVRYTRTHCIATCMRQIWVACSKLRRTSRNEDCLTKDEEEEEEVHEITATDKNNSDFVPHTKSYIFSEFKLLDKHEILHQFRWMSNRQLVQRWWRSESARSFIQTWWIFSLATIYRNPYVLLYKKIIYCKTGEIWCSGIMIFFSIKSGDHKM